MKFAFQPGDRPLDGYTITRAIDRGAFGDVYQAVSDGGKEVALKMIHRRVDLELRGVRQCLNLKHPNLVSIYDVRRDKDGDYWIVMEYISGKRLDQVLAEHPNGLPVSEVHRWLQGIAEGLSFLHSRGVVHRDIKPSNVFLENGQVKIADVGLAKHVTPSRRYANTQDVGTLHYMAPEVGRGRYGPETDIYALGVLLYEMLTGRVPFDGETSAEILLKHLSEPPDLSPVPAPLRPLLADLLQKDPDERLRRAGDLRAVVRRFEEAAGVGRTQGRAEDWSSQRDASWSDEVHADEPSARGFDPPHLSVEPEEDPLTALLRRVWRAVRDEYRSLPTWLQAAVLVVAFVCGLAWLPLLVVMAVVCFVGYVGFRLAYAVVRVLAGEEGPAEGAAQPRAGRAGPPWQAPTEPGTEAGANAPPWCGPPTEYGGPPGKHVAHGGAASRRVRAGRRHRSRVRPPRSARRYSPHELFGPETLRRIPFWQRVRELSAGAALTVPLVALFTALTELFFRFPGDVTADAFFGCVSVLVVWSVLLVSKLLEGREAAPRRSAQFLAGVAVGLAAYALQRTLFVDLAAEGRLGALLPSLKVGPVCSPASGQPTAFGYTVFFGLLLLLRAWWKQADAFRLHRVRVLSVVVTAVLAFVLAVGVVGFPATWAVWWATVSSSVLQLCAPWTPHSTRHRVLQTLANGEADGGGE